MSGWRKPRPRPEYTIVWRRWDSPMLEMTELYEFGNGWALQVVTDLRQGVADASASVVLLAVEIPGVLWQNVTGEEVPPAPNPSEELFWFTEQGDSPDWMTPDGLAMLCAEVASLPPRAEG